MADVAFAERAQDGVGQRVHGDVGVRMTFQPRVVGDFHAAQGDMIAGTEAMHVETRPDARLQRGAKLLFRPQPIVRCRQFHVVLVALDHGDGEPGHFGDLGIVGGLGLGPNCSQAAVRGQNLVETEPLRGLRPPQAGAGHRFGNPRGPVGALQGIGDGQRRDRARCFLQRVQNPRNQIRVHQRPGGVVNQDGPGPQRDQAFQTAQHRLLARRAAGDEGQGFEVHARFLE